MSYGIFITLTDSIEEAKKIAYALVSGKLAACTNIIQSVTSVYEWQDEICEEAEFMLLIKTRRELFEEVKNCVNANHSYDLPAFYMLPIEAGSDEFFSWIKKNTVSKGV